MAAGRQGGWPSYLTTQTNTTVVYIYICKCSQAHSNDVYLFSITDNHDHKVVCYYNSMAAGRQGRAAFLPHHVDPYLCTHVFYAFASIEKGVLSPAHPSDITDTPSGKGKSANTLLCCFFVFFNDYLSYKKSSFNSTQELMTMIHSHTYILLLTYIHDI